MIVGHRFAGLLLLLLALTVQRAAADEPRVGDLLIASPSLDDANFARTVLLIVHHGEDGSIAVALNRPTWVEPEDAFPGVDSISRYQGTVFFGGPVQPAQALLVFERGSRAPPNARQVFGSIYVSADMTLLDGFDPAARDAPRVRLFAGHAAWVPGQLARELAAGAWRTVPAAADQIFADDPTALWKPLPPAGDAVTASLGWR